ncbi:hypothetical protein ACT7DG_18880 [Bacillus cereus]
MTQSAPEFKVLQSIAFLAVVLQSSLLYTMNQGNVLLEQSLIMGMLFNLAKFSAPSIHIYRWISLNSSLYEAISI